jgi:hypothetical protein
LRCTPEQNWAANFSFSLQGLQDRQTAPATSVCVQRSSRPVVFCFARIFSLQSIHILLRLLCDPRHCDLYHHLGLTVFGPLRAFSVRASNFRWQRGGFKKIGPNEFIAITDHEASTRKPHLALHSKWHKVYQHNGINVIGSPETSIPQIVALAITTITESERNRTSFTSFLVCPIDRLFCYLLLRN